MPTSASTLKTVRQLHLYLGVFISPAILFFAFTGALQTFSLHETTRGSSYKPPAWAVTLAQLHKKQNIEAKKPAPATVSAKPAEGKAKADKVGPAAASAPSLQAAAAAMPAPKPKSHLPMKIFFLIVAVGLFTSTLTGLYMAYKYNSNKVVVTGLLIAGIVLPLVLLPF
jgi:hypothetical protein